MYTRPAAAYHGSDLWRRIPCIGAALPPFGFFAQRVLQKASVNLSQMLGKLALLLLLRVFCPPLALLALLVLVALTGDARACASLLATRAR
jgi:hypothetical protein